MMIEQVMSVELIETLWNVNLAMKSLCWATDFELIETLWNVNSTRLVLNILTDSGINRNIVECKYRLLCSHLTASP